MKVSACGSSYPRQSRPPAPVTFSPDAGGLACYTPRTTMPPDQTPGGDKPSTPREPPGKNADVKKFSEPPPPPAEKPKVAGPYPTQTTKPLTEGHDPK